MPIPITPGGGIFAGAGGLSGSLVISVEGGRRILRKVDKASERHQGILPRVFLCALVLGSFDSGGVCSMGPYFEYGIYLVYIYMYIYI